MHQDLELGRPMEITAIVTAYLELARKVGIVSPQLSALHGMISALANTASATTASATTASR